MTPSTPRSSDHLHFEPEPGSVVTRESSPLGFEPDADAVLYAQAGLNSPFVDQAPERLIRGISPQRLERYFAAALRLLYQGRRPTADLLVAECGGSKGDASRVNNYFWQVKLPSILTPKQLVKPPTEVERALANVWDLAVDHAGKVHQQHMDEARAEVDALQSKVDSLTSHAAELMAERDEWKTRCMRAEDAHRQEQDFRRLQEQVIQELRGQLSEAHEAHAQLSGRHAVAEADVARLTAELEAVHESSAADLQREQAATASLTARLADSVQIIDELRRDRATLEADHKVQLENLSRELAAATEKLDRAMDDARRLTAEAGDARQAERAADTRATALAAQLEITRTALDAERSLRTAAATQLGQASARLEAADKARQEAERALARLQEQTKPARDRGAGKPNSGEPR